MFTFVGTHVIFSTMKTLSAFFHRRASWWALAIAFLVYMLFNTVVLPKAEQHIDQLAGQKVGIIDLGMDFDLDKIREQVAAYGPEGRTLYRRTEVTMDIVYPVAYAIFFTLLLSLLMRGLPLSPGLQRANILPFAMEGFDLLENIFLVLLLTAYPEQNGTFVLFLAVFRTLKWVVFLGIAGLILFLIGKRLFGRRAVAKAA